jgi:group II intron reverse transcriptase/maturase
VEQQLNYPNNLEDIEWLMDYLFRTTQDVINKGKKPEFHGLYEIIMSRPIIMKAIHNIKSNKGSNTPGVDNLNMQEDILEKKYKSLITKIQNRIKDYHPQKVKRVYILKSNKVDKRPLGIPTIEDRIIQECVRISIEPILEAQFFKHSYGFRPMRESSQALNRINYIINSTGYSWIIEGDIKGFFDNVNHNVLLKKLHKMGIHDNRVLMLIKQMLKAGVMNESAVNEIGTPQGGIISPLLANVYLHSFDTYIAREWEQKNTKFNYSDIASKNFALKKTNLKPCYIVRYADDWVILTSTKENAVKLKQRAEKYLKNELKLELSQEKTLITNVLQKRIKFLGFEIKGKRRGKKIITYTYADRNRLDSKMKEIAEETKKIRDISDANRVIGKIFELNSKIRGVLNYYKYASHISVQVSKYDSYLTMLAYRNLRKNNCVKAEWIISTEVDNMKSIHQKHQRLLPTVIKEEKKVAITCVAFVKWDTGYIKNPKETPFTPEGRLQYEKRTGKKASKRIVEQIFESAESYLSLRDDNGLYNFEYHLNRPYAYKRDRGKCRCCGELLTADTIHVHHINKALPRKVINKLNNLACVCKNCHELIHKSTPIGNSKCEKKINEFREKLKN